MAKPKKIRTLKQRQADRSRRAVHSPVFRWSQTGRAVDLMDTHVACGKRRFQRGSTFASLLISPLVAEVDCAACVRLLSMTREQHEAHVEAEKKKLADVRAKQQSRADEERAAAVQARVALVAAYRDDALVALDAYLSDVPYERMGEVLVAAVTKYRLDNPRSRGEKLWVMTGDQHDQRRDILCRFCRRKVGHGELGRDHSWKWFDTCTWREFPTLAAYREVYGDESSVVCVGRHTTLCALAYLAGVPCAEPVP